MALVWLPETFLTPWLLALRVAGDAAFQLVRKLSSAATEHAAWYSYCQMLRNPSYLPLVVVLNGIGSLVNVEPDMAVPLFPAFLRLG